MTVQRVHKSIAELSSRQNKIQQDTIDELRSRQNKYHQEDDRSSSNTSEEKEVYDPTFEDVQEPTDTYSYVTTTTTPITKGMNNTTNENMGYTTPTTNQKPVFPTLHKSWKIVLEDNFEPHRFQSFLKDIFLQDDSMH